MEVSELEITVLELKAQMKAFVALWSDLSYKLTGLVPDDPSASAQQYFDGIIPSWEDFFSIAGRVSSHTGMILPDVPAVLEDFKLEIERWLKYPTKCPSCDIWMPQDGGSCIRCSIINDLSGADAGRAMLSSALEGLSKMVKSGQMSEKAALGVLGEVDEQWKRCFEDTKQTETGGS